MAVIDKANTTALPIDFTRERVNQPPSNALPIDFNRDWVQSGDVVAPPTGKRRMHGLSMCFSVNPRSAVPIGRCHQHAATALAISAQHTARYNSTNAIARCFSIGSIALSPVASCQTIRFGDSVLLSHCGRAATGEMLPLSRCQTVRFSESELLSVCATGHQSEVVALNDCVFGASGETRLLSVCASGVAAQSVSIGKCHPSPYQQALPLPSEWYPLPIPETPPPDNHSICRQRPPSSQLPLNFNRERTAFRQPSMLPIDFGCWHDVNHPTIPLLGTYMITNTITCTIDGEPVEILSASVTTDMDSFCWQGRIDLAPDDYARFDFNRPRGEEAVIALTINATRFVFLAEKVGDKRAFLNYQYSISGGSPSVYLSGKYATPKTGVVGSALYARQIAERVLQYTDFIIAEWSIANWLIPKDTYSLTNKTPMQVITEIAQAAGGYVATDPAEKQLFVRKRWPVPAWGLATATPTLQIPASVIDDLSGQDNNSPRKNSVRCFGGSEGKWVYRQGEDKALEAPISQSELYTDDQPMIEGGIAILSDTGKHKKETLRVPWSDEYFISLAKVGDTWAVTESPDKTWQGKIDSVTIDVRVEDDVPVVWQDVVIDRYLDV